MSDELTEEQKEQLVEAFKKLDRVPLCLGKCTHAEEVEPGIVALKTETGASTVFMSRATYEEILAWKEREDENSE